MSSASALGLRVDDAVVLHASNRLAVRLLPCDVVVRIAPVARMAGVGFEVEVARRLAETGSPVAAPDPRVEPCAHLHDGYVMTFWTYYERVPPRDVAPAEYAGALSRLHEGMRAVDLLAPHFTDRVAEAQGLVCDRTRTPHLGDADRDLLAATLGATAEAIDQRRAAEQLLHGEPHPGNLLRTSEGLLFVDLETCCRGPVEFDIAHCGREAPDDSDSPWFIDTDMPGMVSRHYRNADSELVEACWRLMLAMVAAWRWDRADRFPDGRRMGVELLDHLRAALGRNDS